MIHAEGLCKQFDDILAVDDVSLNVSPGRILVLLGPNGAGKTTTVRLLTSILAPTRGSASVAGYDVVKDAEKVRAMVGVLTENHGLYGRMNAQEYLEFFGKLYGMKRDEYLQQIDTLLSMFGLSEFRRKRLGEYSKGMRQKLALTRAMLHRPMVLLLDEPTSAMDPESARIVRDSIRQLRSNERTILLCTHNLLEAEDLADEIAIISQGRIIFSGTGTTMKKQLLGQVEYEASFTQPIDGWRPVLPKGVELTGSGEKSLRFRVSDPQESNPLLIQQILERKLKLMIFQEVPRSLEEAYLQALAQNRQEAANVG
jgi:ABC-2 type transport system ATP-binding protein